MALQRSGFTRKTHFSNNFCSESLSLVQNDTVRWINFLDWIHVCQTTVGEVSDELFSIAMYIPVHILLFFQKITNELCDRKLQKDLLVINSPATY